MDPLYHIRGVHFTQSAVSGSRAGFVDPDRDFCLTGLVPIYEYECGKCRHRFEVIQKIADAPLKKCEKCKGKVERLISSPAIQFKGTGWYVTDYAKKGSREESSKSKSESEKPASSESSESSAKPSKKKKEKAGTSGSSN